MACSSCCAPLHAARDATQPPQGAEIDPNIVALWRGPAPPGSMMRRIQIDFPRPTIVGGYRVRGCQVREKDCEIAIRRSNALANKTADRASAAVSCQTIAQRARNLKLGAGAALDRAVRAIGIDVQRTRSTLDHFARDDHLFDTFQAGQIEHGLE